MSLAESYAVKCLLKTDPKAAAAVKAQLAKKDNHGADFIVNGVLVEVEKKE
jgi:hypothetical protein